MKRLIFTSYHLVENVKDFVSFRHNWQCFGVLQMWPVANLLLLYHITKWLLQKWVLQIWLVANVSIFIPYCKYDHLQIWALQIWVLQIWPVANVSIFITCCKYDHLQIWVLQIWLLKKCPSAEYIYVLYIYYI